MSGGHWDYQTDRACNEVFGWNASADCGLGKGDYAANVKWARKLNPLEDKQLSELIYDVFCLLHSYDWYISADTCEDTYRKDVEYFKNKWLKETNKMLVRREINQTLAEAKEELYKALGVQEDDR